MKIYTIFSLMILSSTITFSHANPTNHKTFHGCLAKTDNSDYSPEGSTQLCLFDTGEFMIAGFGVLKYGVYDVDEKNQRLHFSFKNQPKELYVYSTFDPTIKGTHIQFDGFTDSYTSRTFAQFDNAPLYPIFNPNPNCTSYPYIYQAKQPITTLNVYLQNRKNQSDIRQFKVNLSQKQNKIRIDYIDKKKQLADFYLTYQQKQKKSLFYSTDSIVENGVRYFDVNKYDVPYVLQNNLDDNDVAELNAIKNMLRLPEHDEDIYFDKHFYAYTGETDNFPYQFDKKTHQYHLTDAKKLEIFKANMIKYMGYSEETFQEYINNLSKQALQEEMESYGFDDETYKPILWQYHHHLPTITTLSQFPNEIAKKPLFTAECQYD